MGAIVGGLLISWAGRSEPRPVHRQRRPAAFSDAPVGFNSFTSTMSALRSLGFVHEARGIRFSDGSLSGFGGKTTFRGAAARNWPTLPLLDLATVHGVVPETLQRDFQFAPPTRAPAVKHPVELKNFELQEKWGGETTSHRIASMNDAEAHSLITDVVKHNDLAKGLSFEGCAPPRWKRVFHGAWQAHGRWYVVGTDGTYQSLSAQRRAGIRINREAIVELDVKASHLTILRALAGFPPMTGDPYAIPGLEAVGRKTIKQWVLETIGSGKAIARWSSRTDEAIKQERTAPSLRGPILAVHPYLAEAGLLVPQSLATGLSVPAVRLVNPYVSWLEAEAMTEAMRALRQLNVLAMPVHDSLIVPVGAKEDAVQAIKEGFQRVCGTVPTIEDKTGV